MENILSKPTLLVDIFDAYFFKINPKTGKKELVFKSENLTESGIENALDKEEVRNGKRNKLFAILQSNKSANVKLTQNVFNFEAIAVNTGEEIVTGAGVGLITEDTKLTVVAGSGGGDKTITLPEIPVDDIILSKDGTVLNKGTDYTIADKIVTISKADISADDVIVVAPYKFKTSEKTRTITVKADTLAKGGELILKTIEIDKNNNKVADFYVRFPNVVPDGEWSIDLTSEVQPTDLAINMTVLTSDEDGNTLYEIVEVPVED